MLQKIALTANEPRAEYLFSALRKRLEICAEIDFNGIDPLTKYLAAALSFRFRKLEWWENYQLHPLVQRKRRKNLANGLLSHLTEIDALFMWGSWFHPMKHLTNKKPFFVYIDQSRSLEPLPGEPAGGSFGRKKSYELQVETYKNCAGIFAMSEWAREQTLKSHPYLSSEKVYALGWGACGVDLRNEKPDFASKRRMVLHVSNDFKRKGVDFLIETARQCEDDDLEFVVIGEDHTFNVSNLPSNVRFVGKISDKELLARYFREASAFFLPHRFDRNPHVLIEAMGAGTPLVTSSQGGAIEVVAGKETGFLCPAGDLVEYRKSILTIVNNREVLEKMGRNGYGLVKEYYNWEGVAERAIDIMGATLKGSQQRTAE